MLSVRPSVLKIIVGRTVELAKRITDNVIIIITDPEWVLTAGHCCDPSLRNNTIRVALGAHDLAASEPGRIVIRSDLVVPHENYSRLFIRNDICVVHMESPAPIGGKYISS